MVDDSAIGTQPAMSFSADDARSPWLATGLSALGLTLLMLVRLPGLELAGIAPHWVLLWLITWAPGHAVWQGIVAGVTLGLLLDALSTPYPTHALGLAIAGWLITAGYRRRWFSLEPIALVSLCFGLAILIEATTALQFLIHFHDSNSWSPEASNTAQRIIADLNRPLVPDQKVGINPRYVAQPLYFLRGILWDFAHIGLASAVISSLCLPLVFIPLRSLWQAKRDRL
ncbi:rod shape-determining protein MreD [Synechococcus elongatus]|uniref:Rod shape-determining protein MreD n=1 Tax=Synechococcus elongatus PCC 11801 TaxID=2219813 RepID=A0AAN1QLT6_SYNEL|nr:rod shape-determining protein MreD [Synechococcus elongatus]